MRLVIVSCIIFVCSVNFVEPWRYKEEQRSPVIFIPGDGGSQVDARLNKTTVPHYLCDKTTSDFSNIWLNLEMFLPVIIDCWIDNMKLDYDNETRTTKNTDGVDIRIPGWGDPFSVEYLDPSKASVGSYFKDIGDMLVNDLGYIRNMSLRGAPYDFRKAPNENEHFFVMLKDLVEETYKMNDNTRVTFIVHSMGGPMSLIFLQRQSQQWKDKYMSSVISLAAVWGGTVKALKVFAMGDDLGAYLLPGKNLKRQQITCPSLGWLVPSRLFWNDTEILVQSSTKNYTLKDLQEFFYDVKVPNGWEFRKDNEKYQLNNAAPGVEIHCLHGVEVPTVKRLYYKPGVKMDTPPQLITGDGDGTVNIRSLNGCLNWRSLQKQKIYNQPFPGINHMEILRNAAVVEYIKTVLTVPPQFSR